MKRYFGNLFRDRHISQDRLITFTGDLIQRLTAHNPANLFDERIQDLTAALSRLIRLSSDDFAMLGARKGAKLNKREFRKELPDKLSRIYSVVYVSFGDPSPQMKRVFPKGRRPILRSRDDVLIKHFNTLVSGLTKYEATLGPDVVARASELKARWLKIHGTSKTATGRKAAAEAMRREARQQLEVELHRTVGVLIALFPEEPERYQLYMQESLLRASDSAAKPEEKAEIESDAILSGEGQEAVANDSEEGAAAPLQPETIESGSGKTKVASDTATIRGSPTPA